MRIWLSLLSIAAVMLIAACSGGAPVANSPGDICTPVAEEITWAVTDSPLEVADLPRTPSAVTEYLDLDNPINASSGYSPGRISLKGGEKMAWAIFRVSGYSADNSPEVLRLYEKWATCSQFWIGFADFAHGAWHWLPADKNPDWPFSGPPLYDGQNLFIVPEEGQFYRDEDGAAFVTILIADIEPGDTYESVSLASARLASGTGTFYEEQYYVTDGQPLSALDGYSAVNGNLTVDCTGLSDLGPLRNLVLVTGDLLVTNCTPQHLADLGNLLQVGGSLVLTPAEPDMNLELPGLLSFNKLDCDIDVPINRLSFPLISECERIDIFSTALLNEVSFPKLKTISDEFWLRGDSIDAGTKATEVVLPELASLEDFWIASMPVSTISLPQLQIARSIAVGDVEQLIGVSCSKLEQISHINIRNAPFLSSFSLDNSYKFYPDGEGKTSLVLVGIDKITSLSWFGTYDAGQVLSALTIADCESLDSLYHFDCFGEIGTLRLSGSPALASPHGLDGITLGSELHVTDTALTSLPSFSGITEDKLEWLVLTDNPNLTDISGVTGITKAGSGINLVNNDSLSDMSPLTNLSYCGRGLVIEDNESLLNLDAFSSLRNFHSGNHWDFPTGIVIRYNPSLADISGLSGIATDPDTGDKVDSLVIISNGLADGDQTAWDLVEAWGGIESVGSANIENNG